jgi:hypothetical protein
MLSYKEYKLLNESLYGAFNLGLKNPNTVGSIVSASSINGTEAALEAEAEEAIEEAKKMKKKMDCGSDEEEMEDQEDEKEDSKDSDEESDDEEDEDEDDDEEDDEEEEEPKFMKKRAKKEWSEVLADLETVLEGIDDEESISEIKKGMAILKEGLKKGLKGHKEVCKCNFCKHMKSNKKEGSKKGDEGDEEGLTDKQKDLPDFIKKKIAEKNKGKKNCGKNMKKEEKEWWDSVNSMLGESPDQKHWDGGWSQVGEVQQAVREGEEINEVLGIGTPNYPGKPGMVSRIAKGPVDAVRRFAGSNSSTQDAYMKSAHEKTVEVALARVLGNKQEADELEKELQSTYANHPDAGNKFGSQNSLSNDIYAAMEHIKEKMKQGMSPHDAAKEVGKRVAMGYR